MKYCHRCARKIEYRKKWELNWEHIKYCSEQCRKMKNLVSYEQEILDLLRQRGSDKTICPSELLEEQDKSDKVKMEMVRISARHLVNKGLVQICQQGKVIDPSTAKGPIRIKLIRKD